MVKVSEWKLIISKIRELGKSIHEDVWEDSDEVKAMGGLALFEKELHDFIHRNYIASDKQ